MTLASLLSRVAPSGEPGPADRPAGRPGPIAMLGLSAWCGMVAGLLEVLTVIVHKRFFDTNRLLSMSRHYLWLIPLTDLLIFLIVGSIGALAVILRPSGGRRAVLWALGALTVLPALLVGGRRSTARPGSSSPWASRSAWSPSWSGMGPPSVAWSGPAPRPSP